MKQKRYLTAPLPRSRFIPGQSTRPLKNYESLLGPIRNEVLELSDLRIHSYFLYGLDLFNSGFFWEAHECWEALWQKLSKNSPEAKLIQLLIKVAGIKIKQLQGRQDIAHKMARSIQIEWHKAKVKWKTLTQDQFIDQQWFENPLAISTEVLTESYDYKR